MAFASAPSRSHLRHDARGRDGDAPPRQRQAVAVGEDADRVDDVVEVVERLAHAHEDDVRDEALALGRQQALRARALRERLARPVAEPVAGDDRLRRDLLRRQVAHEPLRAGVAEGAGQRAADLARDAERAAVALGDIDALDLGAAVARARRRHADQPLAGAVLRDLLGDDLGTIERVGFGERAAQALADVRHVLEAARRRESRSSARAARRASRRSRSGTPIAASRAASSARVRPASDGRAGAAAAAGGACGSGLAMSSDAVAIRGTRSVQGSEAPHIGRHRPDREPRSWAASDVRRRRAARYCAGRERLRPFRRSRRLQPLPLCDVHLSFERRAHALSLKASCPGFGSSAWP